MEEALLNACLHGNLELDSKLREGDGTRFQELADERARQIFFVGEVPNFQVIIPDFGTVEGPFQITSIEYAGTHDGEATYEVSLASAGALTFTAAL